MAEWKVLPREDEDGCWPCTGHGISTDQVISLIAKSQIPQADGSTVLVIDRERTEILGGPKVQKGGRVVLPRILEDGQQIVHETEDGGCLTFTLDIAGWTAEGEMSVSLARDLFVLRLGTAYPEEALDALAEESDPDLVREIEF